ncbi:MAG: flavin reductase family protein [Ruminococcus sp.]|nr:flavin reductase family protein [Ruminococcus sp.]
MAEFRSINPQEIFDNPFKLFGSDWGLVTAGNPEGLNTMTVSWGGVGIMWNKPVTFTFIRPTRYTFEFLERNDLFTICFFDESYREALSFCGSKSGRNVNKVEETGLTPMFTEEGTPCFEQARMVLVCKKLYAQFLNEESVLGGEPVLKQYNGDEYHKMYISEILEVLTK